MGILSFFRKSKKENHNRTSVDSLVKINIEQSSNFPKYNKYLEFLNMVNGKRVNEMFIGNTSMIPEKMRPDINNFFKESIEEGLVYITEANESVALSYSKKEFTDILNCRNLPISGNKTELVSRIESNGGLEELYKIGKVSNWIKLTDKGKLIIKAYQTKFNKEYDAFQQHIYNLFLLGNISSACENVITFKKSYPFKKPDFYLSYSCEELNDLCKIIRTSDILEIIGVPDMYNNAILSIVCMYYSFGDFKIEKKIEEAYPEFEMLLNASELIVNKDFPYMDFNNIIRGYPAVKIRHND